jgi:hypothetical protein
LTEETSAKEGGAIRVRYVHVPDLHVRYVHVSYTRCVELVLHGAGVSHMGVAERPGARRRCRICCATPRA